MQIRGGLRHSLPDGGKQGRPVCLSLIWIGPAMRLEDALDQLSPRLINAANEIAAEIALSDSGKDDSGRDRASPAS